MTFNFQITERDYLAFYLLLDAESSVISKKRWRTIVLLAIVGAVFYLLALFFNIYIFTELLPYVIALVLIYPMYISISARQKYRDFIRKRHVNQLNENVTITLLDEEMITTTSKGSRQQSFKNIKEIIERRKHIFIQLQSGECMIVPKYQISNSEKITDQFQKIAQQYNFEYIEQLGFFFPRFSN